MPIIIFTCPICGQDNELQTEIEDVGGKIFICGYCQREIKMRKQQHRIPVS